VAKLDVHRVYRHADLLERPNGVIDGGYHFGFDWKIPELASVCNATLI
jgi:hypothetical protein